MNDQFEDLKQFIDGRLSQSEARLDAKIDSLGQRMDVKLDSLEQRLTQKLDEQKVIFETVADAHAEDIADHEQRAA